MEASDCNRMAVGMAAGSQSSLTGTNFQYHLEGDCPGSKGNKAGQERQQGRSVWGPRFHTACTREEACPLRSEVLSCAHNPGHPVLSGDCSEGHGHFHISLCRSKGNSRDSVQAGHQKGQMPTSPWSQRVACAHPRNKEANESVAWHTHSLLRVQERGHRARPHGALILGTWIQSHTCL